MLITSKQQQCSLPQGSSNAHYLEAAAMLITLRQQRRSLPRGSSNAHYLETAAMLITSRQRQCSLPQHCSNAHCREATAMFSLNTLTQPILKYGDTNIRVIITSRRGNLQILSVEQLTLVERCGNNKVTVSQYRFMFSL